MTARAQDPMERVNVAQRHTPGAWRASEIQSTTRRIGRIANMALTVGIKVRIERDETRHLSRGSWPRFRGKTGTIAEVNRAGRGATEYGVGFGKAKRSDAWFKGYELVVVR